MPRDMRSGDKPHWRFAFAFRWNTHPAPVIEDTERASLIVKFADFADELSLPAACSAPVSRSLEALFSAALVVDLGFRRLALWRLCHGQALPPSPTSFGSTSFNKLTRLQRKSRL